jgi:hypothetical protein
MHPLEAKVPPPGAGSEVRPKPSRVLLTGTDAADQRKSVRDAVVQRDDRFSRSGQHVGESIAYFFQFFGKPAIHLG